MVAIRNGDFLLSGTDRGGVGAVASAKPTMRPLRASLPTPSADLSTTSV